MIDDIKHYLTSQELHGALMIQPKHIRDRIYELIEQFKSGYYDRYPAPIYEDSLSYKVYSAICPDGLYCMVIGFRINGGTGFYREHFYFPIDVALSFG